MSERGVSAASEQMIPVQISKLRHQLPLVDIAKCRVTAATREFVAAVSGLYCGWSERRPSLPQALC